MLSMQTVAKLAGLNPVEEKELIECQCCGWIGNPDELEAPFSGSDPGCPICGNDDFLDIEGPVTIRCDMKCGKRFPTWEPYLWRGNDCGCEDGTLILGR